MHTSHQARMRLALFLSILFVGIVMPRGIVHANVILGSFPDRAAWQGIKAIFVEQVVFQNMESVNLTPELVRVRLQNALRQTGLAILSGIEAKGHGERGPIRPHVGVLAMRVRMDKTSMPLGGQLHSFAITLTFFQRARLHSSQRETMAITWEDSRSVIAGTQRPKELTAALDDLVNAFVLDFTSGQP